MPDGAATPRFRLYRRDEIDLLPDPVWLVDHFLPAKGVGVWYGESGVGKTFVVLSLAAAIVTGRDVFGLAALKGNVIYFGGEGASGIKSRLRAWEQYHAVRADGFCLYTGRPEFAKKSDVASAIAECSALQPRLCIIDTLSAHFTGGDENSAKEMTPFIDGARTLSEALDCHVLIVHHEGKKQGNGARGSSALKANCDSYFYLSATNTPGQVTLTCEKQKDGPSGDPILIDLLPQHIEGDEDGSVVAVRGTEIELTLDQKPLTKNEEAALSALADGPLRYKDILSRSSLSQGSFDAALKSLRTKTLIRKASPEKNAPWMRIEPEKPLP